MSASQELANVAAYADIAANLATASGVIVAIAGGWFALVRHRTQLNRSNWLEATGRYAETLREQMDDPGLRGGAWSRLSETDRDARDKYRIFINRLLWALEGICRVTGGKDHWAESVALIGSEHRDYFQSADFRSEQHIYDTAMMRMLNVDCHGHPSADREVSRA